MSSVVYLGGYRPRDLTTGRFLPAVITVEQVRPPRVPRTASPGLGSGVERRQPPNPYPDNVRVYGPPPRTI